MRGYFVYIFGIDGHVIKRIDIECEDDAAALIRAKEVAKDGHYELWEGSRKLAITADQRLIRN